MWEDSSRNVYLFIPRLKLIGVVMFCVEFFLEALPFLGTSRDFEVLIRQKLVFPTDDKIVEGLTLTRDQMTASIGLFSMGLILRPPHFIFLASTAQFQTNLLGKEGERGIFSY